MGGALLVESSCTEPLRLPIAALLIVGIGRSAYGT